MLLTLFMSTEYGIAMIHKQQIHGMPPKNMVLPLFVSTKHGITMVHVQNTWLL